MEVGRGRDKSRQFTRGSIRGAREPLLKSKSQYFRSGARIATVSISRDTTDDDDTNALTSPAK